MDLCEFFSDLPVVIHRDASSSGDGYRVIQIGHKCELGDKAHDMERCGEPCTNLVVRRGDPDVEIGYEVEVMSPGRECVSLLESQSSIDAIWFVTWIEAAP